MVLFTVTKKATTPFDGQKPGTSGLRKKVTVFQQPHYLQNFVQSTFNALPADKVKGATIVVSGDGRYFSKDAVQIITKMAAANGVRRVWVGLNSLLSTPAVSAVIRERVAADGSKATGAFILTASHNPGGPTEDFGIKYNMENGGPAPESVTDKIFSDTKTITEYLIAEDLPDVDISVIGVTSFSGPEGPFDVDVFDSTTDYIKLMKTIFDFESIKKLLASPKFTFCFDALHGVAGIYAKHIFVEELGANESSLLNCVPKEDFGGGHPDPNLTYAKELVDRMGLGKSTSNVEPPEFGAAADGDADRNMVLGKRFFVTPSDSVAIIAANAVQSIPYFASGLNGVARAGSMPKIMPRSMEILDAAAAPASAPTKESSVVSLHYPVLTRSNYATWAMKMKVYMRAQGVWDAIEPGDVDTRKDQMALAAIYQGVPEDTLFLLAEKETAKAAWDALKTMHMGAERVREAKVQTLKSEFEVLRMTESESVDDFAIRLTTIVNKIRGLGEKMEESYAVRKFLRATPAKFLPVVSPIEQSGDLKAMTIEELISRLKAHEERLVSYGVGADDQHLLLTRAEWEAQSKKRDGFGKKNKGTFDKAKVRCYNCQEYGHYSWEKKCHESKKENEAHLVLADADDEPALL